MTEREPFLVIDAPDFEVRARPRLTGVENRRPDAALKGFQNRLVRSFVNVPEVPFEHCVVTVDVPNEESLPTVATLKAVIDALEKAHVIDNDRRVLAARIRKYRLVGDVQPTVSIEVLPRDQGVASFIRSFPEQQSQSQTARAVTAAVPYLDRSGVSGSATFSAQWAGSPPEYEAVLRNQWQALVDTGAISETGWMAAFPLTARLTVHLPHLLTEDADNALLYVIDLLELARRDALGDDAGPLTIDQLLVEAFVLRDIDAGVYITAEPVDPFDQYEASSYYTTKAERVDPFDPEST